MKRLFPIFMAILIGSILLLNQTGTHSVTQAQGQTPQVPQVTLTPIPPPTITFSASPPVIVHGNSVTLDWAVQGASEGRIHISPEIPEMSTPPSAEGSVAVSPQSTTTYRLEACNQAGCSSKEATVEVKVKPPLIRQFWADKSLLLQGDAATLTWNVDIEGTASIVFYVDHPEEGETVPASSSKTVAPETTTTYRLKACNETDCDHKETTIVVNLKPPLIRRFEADPEAIDQGQSTTLRWEIEGAEIGYLYPDTRGGGPVTAASWKTTPPLEDTTVYKLEACNSAGCNYREVTVIVNTPIQEAESSPQAGEQETESQPPKLSIAPILEVEEQQLKVDISNTGSVTAYDIVVTLSGPYIEPQEKTIDQLEGGESQEVVFRLKKEPGPALRIDVQSTNASPEFQELFLASPTLEGDETSPSAPAILYLSAAIVVMALFSLTALGVFYITRQRKPAPAPADTLPDDLERLWRQRTESKKEEEP